jgi:Putative auto-transporter adhesin, head GIN domain
MKTASFALLCIAATAAPAAAAERNFTITSFDRIRIDGPFKVRLTTGVPPFATATGPDSGIDGVSVAVEGRTLIVRSNASAWGGYPGAAKGPIEVAVGTHDLSAAWVNGSGTLAVDRIRGLSFELALQGSGSVAVSDADVDQLKIGVSGSGNVTIAGKAPRLTAIVRGTSSLDAASLSSKDALVGAEGPTQVRFLATGTAKVDASGTAAVEVAGNPACTVKAEGSATVTGCDRAAR